MTEGTVITQLECGNCGYKWYPRSPNPPKVCPNCKHRDWQEKKEDKDVNAKNQPKTQK